MDSLHERNVRRYRKPRIGFFGCGSGAGQVIRMQRKDPHTVKQQLTISCPACGHDHDVRPFWREYVPKVDDGKEIMIVD
jgi:ribosomal protein L44E